MVQVNGFQNPGLAFAKPAGGLGGFQRQGMDQRKKATGGFVGVVYTSGAGAVTVTFPAAAAVGDLALCWAVACGASPAISGWTAITPAWSVYTWNLTLLWKVLTAADLAGVTITGGGIGGTSVTVTHVYRGVTSAALKFTNENSTNPAISTTGFAKNVNSKLLVAACVNRDFNSATDDLAMVGSWTVRKFPLNLIAFGIAVGDLQPSGYADGDLITFTGLATDDTNAAMSLELT